MKTQCSGGRRGDWWVRAVVPMAALALGGPALAQMDTDMDMIDKTGQTGGGQPFSIVQPSLSLTYFVPQTGQHPTRDGSTNPGVHTLGAVRMFAGNFAPWDSLTASGQRVRVDQNPELFSLLGAMYGGDGRNDFHLPNLDSRAPVGVGHASGLSDWQLGQTRGSAEATLSVDQMPNHQHWMPEPIRSTDFTGGSSPLSLTQPSLGLNYIIATDGVFTSPESGTGDGTFLGQIALFAGNFAPSGWEFANGQRIAVNANSALFSMIGTTYGGDGETDFALPDLRGRVAVQPGSGPGLEPVGLGQKYGAEQVSLTTFELPSHNHPVTDNDPTGHTGASLPFPLHQPSLGINYLIATQGVFPSRDSGRVPGESFLGEITQFAGDFAPRGWALANGQLLDINQNQALFSLLGTTYGGDGETNFALPDLRGRTGVNAEIAPGLDPWPLGERRGADNAMLTANHLPPHYHDFVNNPGDLPTNPIMASSIGPNGEYQYTDVGHEHWLAIPFSDEGRGYEFSFTPPDPAPAPDELVAVTANTASASAGTTGRLFEWIELHDAPAGVRLELWVQDVLLTTVTTGPSPQPRIEFFHFGVLLGDLLVFGQGVESFRLVNVDPDDPPAESLVLRAGMEFFQANLTASVIPEPASLALLAMGGGLALRRRHRR